MNSLHVLASGFTWPAVAVVVALLFSFTVLTMGRMASRFARSVPSSGLSTPRLDAIDDQLQAIRTDIADLRESIAELDRMFKSVG
ncbi:MAG: hypothetical protein QOF21_2200 [Actinomycetota bacterium]|jgi:hypothetical protein